MRIPATAGLVVLLFGSAMVHAQPAGVIYDEAKVPEYTLPDPLVMVNGQKVATADKWFKQRRPEILRLFETHVYGRSPGKPAEISFDVTSTDRKSLGGKAIRKEV